jgi:hypothetical protein
MKSVASNMAPLATAAGISESKDAVQYGNRANLPSHRLRAAGGRRAAIHRRDPLRSWQTNHCATIEQKVEKHRECVSVPPNRVLSFGNLVRAASRPDPGIIPRLVPDDNPFWKPSETDCASAPRKQTGCRRRSWSGSSPGPQEDVARLQDAEVGDLSPAAVTDLWQARQISVF